MKKLFAVFVLLASATASHTSSFTSGATTCPTSGTKQVSATPAFMFSLTVQADTANAGTINFGGSNVTTSTGVQIPASGSFTISREAPSISPSTLYFACSTNTDGITWIGVQ